MSNLCEQIYKDKLQSNLSIDKKLCCGDAGCFNHDTCYYPSILVMCRAIINAGACERGSQPDIKEWNNTLAREFCGNEKNISKHICVSTNSTIHGPDLDGELNWIVNRTSNLGDSCQSCTCCDERKQCIRLPVNCAHACNSTTVLNNCKSLPNQHSKTGLSCDDLFGSGSC
ncbi:6217_t:CDS:1 [Rhizophagus irregularis]|nr:6217_t:CDS:1 [Rhizophagus irregularis]